MIAREHPTGPIACWRVRRALQSYLDGMLAEATARRVGRHLESCRRCLQQAQTYQAIKNSLGRRYRSSPEAVQRLCDFGETLRHESGE